MPVLPPVPVPDKGVGVGVAGISDSDSGLPFMRWTIVIVRHRATSMRRLAFI
jgi:hypothetical protein